MYFQKCCSIMANLIVPLSRMMYNDQFSLSNEEKALKALCMDLLYIIVLFVK